MQLPTKIAKSPVLHVIIELKFISTVKAEDVLGVLYPILKQDFPHLTLPNQSLLNIPVIKFASEKYVVSVSNTVLGFELKSTYPLWATFIKDAMSVINKALDSNLINTVQRIGLRYINIFRSEQEVNKIFKENVIGYNYNDFRQSVNIIDKSYTNGQVSLTTKIASQAEFISTDSKQIGRGVYLDIDASIEEAENYSTINDIRRALDDLHSYQKDFFFSIINANYLNTLEPSYE